MLNKAMFILLVNETQKVKTGAWPPPHPRPSISLHVAGHQSMIRQMMHLRRQGLFNTIVRRSVASALRYNATMHPHSHSAGNYDGQRLQSSLASHETTRPIDRMEILKFIDTLNCAVESPWKLSLGGPQLMVDFRNRILNEMDHYTRAGELPGSKWMMISI